MTASTITDNIPAICTVGELCCGCGACVAACPVNCLSMEPDEFGFVHPRYESGCMGCGMCGRACPVLTVGDEDVAPNVEWAKAKDDALRGRSSSGAVFGVFARDVLSRGGVVYGAAFTSDCKAVRHVRADNEVELDSVMRSKYVQSTIGMDVYKSLETDLRDSRCVLFSGAACQCAGVRNYLKVRGVPTDTLLLIDVICHGVPSPRLWVEWLDLVSREAGCEVDEVNFRSKSTGWLTFSVAYCVATEKVRSQTNSQDWYMRAFLQNASLRQSCLDCPAKRKCGSDVTLGDFWGIQAVHPEVTDRLGVSAVICNTQKGVAMLDSVRDQLIAGTSSMGEVVPGNPALVRSVEAYPKRQEFLADVASSMGIDELRRKWTFEPSFKQKLRGRLSGLKKRVLGPGCR